MSHTPKKKRACLRGGNVTGWLAMSSALRSTGCENWPWSMCWVMRLNRQKYKILRLTLKPKMTAGQELGGILKKDVEGDRPTARCAPSWLLLSDSFVQRDLCNSVLIVICDKKRKNYRRWPNKNAEQVWKTMAWATHDGDVPFMKALRSIFRWNTTEEVDQECLEYEGYPMNVKRWRHTWSSHNRGVDWDTPK